MSAEFDKFAHNYAAAMDNPLKKISGKTQDDFLWPKVNLMLEFKNIGCNSKMRVLDFGCGSGDFLRLLSSARPNWSLEGTDISSGMLEEANRRFLQAKGPIPKLFLSESLLNQDQYDIIIASCVFHHIPPADWEKNFDIIAKLLKPKGHFFLFEHNPWNPLTQLIVKTSKIDQNAVLLSSRKALSIIKKAGFNTLNIQYFMFLPPKLIFSKKIDCAFREIPLGAQYFISAALF
jgi:SAM-dependent methyltransferase